MRCKRVLCLLAVVSLTTLVGCGGGSFSSSSSGSGSGSGNPPGTTPSLTSITITPALTTLNIGSQQQLKATGNYSDGSSKDLTSKVSWSSSSTSIASISSSGMVTGLKSGKITITASDSKITGDEKFSVVAVLESIAVSPMGPGIVVGGVQAFTATGSFNDGSIQDITSSVTWTSSDTTKATVSTSGHATGIAVGVITVTAASNNLSANSALDIVSKAYANFSGPYAFELVSADSRGPAFFDGSITADGHGNLTGVEDSNTADGVKQNISIAGTYMIYPDGRGNMVFNPNVSHPSGITLRFILASGGTFGGLIEFDGNGVAKGTLRQQNSAAFNAASLTGTYVFRDSGIDSGKNSSGVPQATGAVGVVAVDGSGNITSGTEDSNDYGVINALESLNPSTYAVDSDGRGTLQLINSSGTTNYAFYVVDSTRINFVQIDAAPASAVAGVAELQSPHNYAPTALTSSFAFLLDRPAVTVSGQNFTFADYEQIGSYSFDSSDQVTGIRNWESVNGAATFTGQGRGALTTNLTGATGSNQDYRAYSFYMVSPTKMYLLQTYALPTVSALTPETGEADLQTDMPYSEATLKGAYVLQAYNLSTDATSLMLLEFDGSGGIQGIVDLASAKAIGSTEIGPAQFVTQPKGSGFLQVQIGIGNQALLSDFYLISNQQAWAGALNPPLDGSLQLR